MVSFFGAGFMAGVELKVAHGSDKTLLEVRGGMDFRAFTRPQRDVREVPG